MDLGSQVFQVPGKQLYHPQPASFATLTTPEHQGSPTHCREEGSLPDVATLHLRQPSGLPFSFFREKQNHAGSVAVRLPLRNTRT